MSAILIKTTGESTPVAPKGDTFTLEELQGYVGGLIQIVPLGDSNVLVCNEEGKIDGKSMVNPEATKVWIAHYGETDVMFGDVLVCDSGLIE